MKPPEVYLKHILVEIDYILTNTEKVEYDKFIQEETLKRSVVRAIEVIGEAIKNLPDNFRKKHSDIPWKEMAGLRDILIHHYFGVDYKTVWDVVKNKIPKIKNQIESLLKISG